MITVGVLGATGQVGTEVCLFLKTYAQINVVAISRSEVGTALLKRLDITCRIGVLGTDEEIAALLKDCDVVIDFAAIISTSAETYKKFYYNNITKVLKNTPKNTKYIFVSTINAFGMGSNFNKAKYYFIPHTLYAITKRYAENLTRKLGKKYGKETYIFRLGHVHGFLQRVSEETMKLIATPYKAFHYPNTPSYTVFCFTIAEAIVNIAENKEKTGTYTVVSTPAWSWEEVLKYYALPNQELNIKLIPIEKRGILQNIVSGIKNSLMSFIVKYRETFRANILAHYPDLENKIRRDMLQKKANAQIETYKNAGVYSDKNIHEGEFGGNRLTSISDSRKTMAEKARQVQEMLNLLG